MPEVSPDRTLSTRSKTASPHRRGRSKSPRLRLQIKRLTQRLQRDNERSRQLEDANRSLGQEVAWLRQQLDDRQVSDQSPSPAPVLDDDRPLSGHQFGIRLIALSIELAKRVGFRATEFVLTKVFQTLGLQRKVPSHDAIEQWTLRLGVAELSDTFSKDQRVLWMADHSSQIGKEKVLLIIGILVDDLPQPGQTLDFEKLKVLAIVPGKHWKKEDVGREYKRLAAKIGPPVYVLCDGAVELRDPAENLAKNGAKTIVLRDLKHMAANLFEKQVGRDERFKAFITEVGLTRNRIQQTELSHFTPPPLKQKSRFMNLAPLLRWARMIVHHLDHPEGACRAGITTDRMEEKLGWVRGFVEELSQWCECQEVIDRTLAWINSQGLSDRSGEQLRTVLGDWLDRSAEDSLPAGELAARLVQFVNESQQKLPPGERAWLSTEILESLFGRFKQLERQHSKGGFTRLLAALPTLCRHVSAELVRVRFANTKANDLKQWLHDTLPNTLTARRNAAYKEARTT
jgi:hypothetical protein